MSKKQLVLTNSPTGNYIPTGNYKMLNTTSFWIGEDKYFINERKNPGKKPKYYLAVLHSGKRFNYISSMFEVGENTYRIDDKSIVYQMEINQGTNTVIIQQTNLG